MKKLFIGLLVVAAGAGVYFFALKKKKDQPVTAGINKEWIIGKWKTTSIEPLKDSAQPRFRYDFQKDGFAYRSISDTAKADTISYAWKESGELLIKERATDTTGVALTVALLTADSLKVKTGDNIEILFTKLK